MRNKVEVVAELHAMLRRNERRRRAGKEGLELTEVLIAARLVVEVNAGKPVYVKTLVNEVAPDIVSATTAHRMVREMLRKGMIAAVESEGDHRTMQLTYTRKLYASLTTLVN